MGKSDFANIRKTRRIIKTREERKSVLISLEDTKSSKYYFQELLKDKDLTGEVIFAKHIGTDPLSVVNAIVMHKTKHHNVKYEKAWAVFDRDSWTKHQINGAISRAKALNICIGISNEAYELWILLHFEKIAKHTSRKELNSKLNEHFLKLCGQEYSKSSQDVYRYIIGLQPTAIKNSEYLVQHYTLSNGSLDPDTNNPLTLVHELVKCLNSLYTSKQECKCYPH